MVNSLLPVEVNVSITIDDIRLGSNLNTNKTMKFTEKSFFYTIIGFTQSHSGPLKDIEGFIHLIRNTYNSDNSVNFTGVDKIHLKCDCIDGSE